MKEGRHSPRETVANDGHETGGAFRLRSWAAIVCAVIASYDA